MRFSFHGLGHDLGLRVHDASDRTRRLEPGMIVTNEPGIYVRVEKDKDIGVRIKDDILVAAT